MRRLINYALCLVMLVGLVQSTYGAVVTVLPNNLGTSGNGRAPQGSRTFINTLYYILPSEMTASGFGADIISSVGWTWTAGVPQNTTTTGNLKVYVQNSTDLAYSKGTTFSTVGMTKIIDGTITITNSGVAFSIDVPTGGPGTSVFNTVAGQGVYVAFEYQTTTALALPLGAPTVSCNAAVSNSLGTYQSNVAYGTLMTLSAFRPETRFGNPLSDFSNVQDVYCLSNAGIPFSNTQSLAAKIKNEALSAQTYDVTFTVQEKATATVRYTNTQSVSFTAGEVKTVTAAGWAPTIQELDTVIVSVATIGGETVTSNNSKGYRHNVNSDTYGVADLTASNGGVGFGTGTGQILNRYTMTGCSNIEAVRVYINDLATIGNTIKGVVCNATGAQVAESAPHVVTAGENLTWVTLPLTVPPGFSNADFFVGVEQAVGVTAYYPVGTQPEASPSRTNVFYSNNAGGGALVGPYTTLGRWMLEAVVTPLSSNPVASGPATACAGDDITLTATFTELNPAAVVNWYTDACGGTLVGTGTSITIPAVAGSTTYYVRAEDACNSYTTPCASVTVVGGAAEAFFADADGDTYGDPAMLTVSCTGAPVGYVTDASDCDDTNSAVNPSATEVCNGIDDNCDGTIDEGVVTATITAPFGLSACKPNFVQLNANTGVGYTYQWFKNGTAITGATNATYSTNKPAYYQVQVSIPAGCFAVSDPVLVDILTAPNANISAPNGTSLCTTVKLKASYAVDYTWQWRQGGFDIPGATNYTHIATSAGNYTCVVTNTAGCSRETAIIAVTACREGDLAAASEMSVYPNPTSSDFTLELNSNDGFTGVADIYVINVVGEVVFNGQTGVNSGYMNTAVQMNADLAGGLYLVKVMMNGKEYTEQLMIVR